MRATRYVAQMTPFIIATYLTYVVYYFALIKETDSSQNIVGTVYDGQSSAKMPYGSIDQPNGTIDQRTNSINNDDVVLVKQTAIFKTNNTEAASVDNQDRFFLPDTGSHQRLLQARQEVHQSMQMNGMTDTPKNKQAYPNSLQNSLLQPPE